MLLKSTFFPSECNTPNKTIKRIVCCSGGARGTSLAGVKKAFDDTNLLDDVEFISGSSAGAIFGSFLATSVPYGRLYKTIVETSLFSLLGERTGSFINNAPGKTFLSRDGLPLENTIRELILITIKDFFDELNEINSIINEEFLLLYMRFKRESAPIFTFKDLKILHTIFPKRFTKLVVVTTICPTGEPFVFDCDLTPNEEIAKACHASAAIQGVLEPVFFQIGDKSLYLMDGGFYEHLPTDYFDKASDNTFLPNTLPENTLILTLADKNYEQSTAYKALYGTQNFGDLSQEKLYTPGFFDGLARDYLAPFFASLDLPYYNTNKWNESWQRIRANYAQNTIIIDVSDIAPYQYNAATKYGKEMCGVAYLDTIFHINNHKLTATYFPPNFFINFVHHFEIIYAAILCGRGECLQDDSFAQALELFKKNITIQQTNQSEKKLTRAISEFIRDSVRSNLHSIIAFAITSAVGYTNKTLTSELLLKEICVNFLSLRERSYSELLLFIGLTGKANIPEPTSFEELLEKIMDDTENPIKHIFGCLMKIPLFQKDMLQYSSNLRCDPFEFSQVGIQQ